MRQNVTSVAVRTDCIRVNYGEHHHVTFNREGNSGVSAGHRASSVVIDQPFVVAGAREVAQEVLEEWKGAHPRPQQA